MLLNLVAIEKDDWQSKMLKFVQENNFVVRCLHLRTPDTDWEVESLYITAFTSAYAQRVIKSLFTEEVSKFMEIFFFETLSQTARCFRAINLLFMTYLPSRRLF